MKIFYLSNDTNIIFVLQIEPRYVLINTEVQVGLIGILGLLPAWFSHIRDFSFPHSPSEPPQRSDPRTTPGTIDQIIHRGYLQKSAVQAKY